MLPAFLMLVISCGPSALARPRQPMPPLPEMAPVLWQEHFDQAFPYDIDDPSTLTIEDFGELVESWSGYGLGRSGVLLPAYTLPGVDDQGRALINPGSGAVRLWISPSWSSSSIKKGTGPGDLGCLLEMSAADGRSVPVVCWSLVINPDGTRISLVADSDSGVVELLGAPIQWTAGQAHFVTLNFGTNATALYLDGQLAVQGAGTIALPASVARLTFGSASTGTEAVQAMIDELYSFRRPLTAADVAFYYTGNAAQAALGPITVEEDLVRAARVLAIRSQPSRTVQSDAMLLETLEESGASAYEDGTLWIEITGATSNEVSVAVHGTQVDMAYELLSKTNLADTIWVSEGQPFLGQDGQTATTVTPGERTNSLFLRARSWVDSDGSGMPDWWQLQWFGQTGVDPYGDDDHDGWSNLQEYQNGTNPKAFDTPPPPQAFRASVNQSTWTASLTWVPSGGSVTGYTIVRFTPVPPSNPTCFTLGPTNSFSDPSYTPYTNLPYGPDYYSIQALYPGGGSEEVFTCPFSNDTMPRAHLKEASNGMAVLGVWSIPPGATTLRLTTTEVNEPFPFVTATNLPLSLLANSFISLPETTIARQDGGCYYHYVQAVWPDGSAGLANWLDSRTWEPFRDGRLHIKQNIAFVLRAAGLQGPFHWFWNGTSVNHPTNYAFVCNSSGPTSPWLTGSSLSGISWSLRLPFDDNYLYRNMVFSQDELQNNGELNTGFFSDFFGYEFYLTEPHAYYFNPLTNDAVLGANDTRWIMPTTNQANLGIITSPDEFFLPDDVTNWFGLNLESVMVAKPGTPMAETVVLNKGGTIPRDAQALYRFYPEFQQPQLETVDWRFLTFSWNWISSYSQWPANQYFDPAAPVPSAIVPYGESVLVSAFARQRIVNGRADIPVFTEQYLEGAYTLDSNGVVTSQAAGILSPQHQFEDGNFFATEPGPAAIVTMPDVVTNQRGTGVVHVVKLQLDVNHDGTMDLSFAGPDNTSWDRPFVFWINNDHDEPASGSNPDRDLNTWGNPPENPPDYTCGAIRCQRNLEDFARLWICGMPTLPADYTVQFGWSSVSSGSPRIRLYWASQTNSSIGYLTNTTIAAQQIAQHNTPIGEISPTSTLTLPANVFSNGLTEYFLFEAGTVGSGQLTLTISQGGTNTIAQTSAWLDFHDITDLYEQARVTNVIQEWPDMVQTNLTSGFQVLSHATATPGDAKQLAVFIHGWRMGAWDWHSFSETMFKRLYWQGYQGRFAALTWPTRSAESELFPQVGYITYNRSERIAFKSGTGAAAYLNDLRNRFPDYTISGCSHSMGGIVAMETLKELAAAGQQPVNNWVLMQAAVPAQCFDTNAPNFQMFLNGEAVVPTPDVYRNYAAGITNALRPSGKIANFFNPDDFALWNWQLNQAFYVANLLGNGVTTMKPNAFFGYSTDGTNSLLSTNAWNQSFYSVIYGGYYGNGPTRAVTNPLELMPFVARPRGLAVGASPNVHGQIQGQQLDLENQLGFGAAEGDHSGEFNRNIQELPIWPFYSQLRTNLFPHP